MLTQIAHFSNPHIFFSQVRFQQRKSHRSRRRQSSRSTSRRRKAAAKEADKQIMDSKVSPTVYRYNVKFIKFDKTLGL